MGKEHHTAEALSHFTVRTVIDEDGKAEAWPYEFGNLRFLRKMGITISLDRKLYCTTPEQLHAAQAHLETMFKEAKRALQGMIESKEFSPGSRLLIQQSDHSPLLDPFIFQLEHRDKWGMHGRKLVDGFWEEQPELIEWRVIHFARPATEDEVRQQVMAQMLHRASPNQTQVYPSPPLPLNTEIFKKFTAYWGEAYLVEFLLHTVVNWAWLRQALELIQGIANLKRIVKNAEQEPVRQAAQTQYDLRAKARRQMRNGI